jgi:hypothetical protein
LIEENTDDESEDEELKIEPPQRLIRPGILSEPHFRTYRFFEMCLQGMRQREMSKFD